MFKGSQKKTLFSSCSGGFYYGCLLEYVATKFTKYKTETNEQAVNNFIHG